MTYRGVYRGADSTCWRKIADCYRTKIVSGELAPGSRLPSTQELAKEYDTSVYSVQYALAALSHEGLITRMPRRGTVVNEFVPGLKTVGIFIFIKEELGFDAYRRTLVSQIVKKLHEKGTQAAVLIEDEAAPDLMERIRRTIRQLEIQAIILFSCAQETMSVFRKINIPFITDSPFPVMTKGFLLPRYEFPPLAVQALASHGRKKPALFTTFTDRGLSGNGWLERHKVRFFQEYEKTVREKGMEFREERIFRPEGDECCSPLKQIQFGYRMFHRLWKQKDRPDSLIVFTDGLIPGIVLAMAESDVRSPEHLLIARHSNTISEIFVPFPTIRIEVDVLQAADLLTQNVFLEFQREKRKKSILHFNVLDEVGKTANSEIL